MDILFQLLQKLQGHFSMERHKARGRRTDGRIKAKLSTMSPDNHIKPISVYTLHCTKCLCLVGGGGGKEWERKREGGRAYERETERLSGVCSCLNALRLQQNTKRFRLALGPEPHGQRHTSREESLHLKKITLNK